MTFTGRLLVSPMDDGTYWVLENAIQCTAENGEIYTVPAGFITDFASSRIGSFNLLPLSFVYGISPVLHDYLYSTGIVTRSRADSLFLEAMISQKRSRWIAYKAYFGVRIFGKYAWTIHARNRFIRSQTQA